MARPELLAQAGKLSWTLNVVIVEAELATEDRAWYVTACARFGWCKDELMEQINANAHLEKEVDEPVEMCYDKGENEAAQENHVAAHTPIGLSKRIRWAFANRLLDACYLRERCTSCPPGLQIPPLRISLERGIILSKELVPL